MQHRTERDDTPMGRALAGRAVQMPRPVDTASAPDVRFDLTVPDRQPLFPVVRDAVKEALSSGETHYTARTGIEPLRAAIAERSSAEGFPATVETTVVTNGGSEALYIALQTLVTTGDRVLLVEPVSPQVVDVVRFIGGEPVLVSYPDDAAMRGAAVLVLAAPSGISGRGVSAAELIGMIGMANHHGVSVVVDRSSEPDRIEPAAPFPQPGLAAGVITIGSFSGMYRLDSWRVGYFTAPADYMEPLAGLKEAMSISTTTLSQYAALALMGCVDDIVVLAGVSNARHRGIVFDILKASRIPFMPPEVHSGLLLDIRRSGLDDVQFAQRLLVEGGVRVEPASRFGRSLAGYVRIDLRAPEEVLTEGLSRLASFMEELS